MVLTITVSLTFQQANVTLKQLYLHSLVHRSNLLQLDDTLFTYRSIAAIISQTNPHHKRERLT
jgi:hypothetical protein